MLIRSFWGPRKLSSLPLSEKPHVSAQTGRRSRVTGHHSVLMLWHRRHHRLWDISHISWDSVVPSIFGLLIFEGSSFIRQPISSVNFGKIPTLRCPYLASIYPQQTQLLFQTPVWEVSTGLGAGHVLVSETECLYPLELHFRRVRDRNEQSEVSLNAVCPDIKRAAAIGRGWLRSCAWEGLPDGLEGKD